MRISSLVVPIVLTMMVFSIAHAEEAVPPEVEAVPDAPPIPEPVRSGESLDPQITIIQRDDEIVREYRYSGRLYMVQVTPTVGRPYYLVDTDGDGDLETRRHELGANFLVPHWVLVEW